MSYTFTNNYNLKKVTYNTEDNTWGDILGENFDNLDTVIKTISDQLTPVGTVIGLHKSMTGVPTLIGTWVECNGQTISDSGSPLDGEILDDLNGDSRFLRGSSTSGTLQNDEIISHKHDDSGHNHQYYGSAAAGSDWGIKNDRIASPTSNYIMNGSADLGDPTDSGTGAGTPAHGNETRPINMSIVWIIRIK